MGQPSPRRNARSLVILIATALCAEILFHFLPRLSGLTELEGLMAVLLGLYICSQPAANALNLLLYGTLRGNWRSLSQPDLRWLALNFVALVSGLSLIVTGTTRFFSTTL